jgi:hypothetical protein
MLRALLAPIYADADPTIARLVAPWFESNRPAGLLLSATG